MRKLEQSTLFYVIDLNIEKKQTIISCWDSTIKKDFGFRKSFHCCKGNYSTMKKKNPSIWSLPSYPIARDDSYLVKLLAYHEKKNIPAKSLQGIKSYIPSKTIFQFDYLPNLEFWNSIVTLMTLFAIIDCLVSMLLHNHI